MTQVDTHQTGTHGHGGQRHSPQRKRWHVALWTLQILIAALYVSFGMSMLTGAEEAVVIFDRIGWGDWFRYLIGALNVVFAIGLLIPRLSRAAAVGLIGIILVAIVSHAAIGDANGLVFLVPLALVGVIVWGRRNRAPLPRPR